jgi:AbrB family looped-hinge helix DNA binding protein
MRATVGSNGQITLPAKIRRQDRIMPGQEFEIVRVKEGEYLLKRVILPKASVLEWLQRCPAKGWFEHIHSEYTDTL